MKETKKSLFKIEVWYFKSSGKFYASGEFSEFLTDCSSGGPPICYMNGVVECLRKIKPLPGLCCNKWEGPVLVNCDKGYPVLLPNGVLDI
jgi:hypothetical protein